jgi:hypothetical protein
MFNGSWFYANGGVFSSEIFLIERKRRDALVLLVMEL